LNIKIYTSHRAYSLPHVNIYTTARILTCMYTCIQTGGAKEDGNSNDDAACEAVSKLGYLKDVTCGYLELFGSTPQAKRHPLVKRFNHTDVSELAVFLLSTRAAGGTYVCKDVHCISMSM
jgi:hypothetical protein